MNNIINKINLLNIIKCNYISNKFNNINKYNNIIILIVNKSSNKIDIKNAFLNLFNIKVKKINILLVKNKINKKINNYKNNSTKICKKAYVTICSSNKSIILKKINILNKNLNNNDNNKI